MRACRHAIRRHIPLQPTNAALRCASLRPRVGLFPAATATFPPRPCPRRRPRSVRLFANQSAAPRRPSAIAHRSARARAPIALTAQRPSRLAKSASASARNWAADRGMKQLLNAGMVGRSLLQPLEMGRIYSTFLNRFSTGQTTFGPNGVPQFAPSGKQNLRSCRHPVSAIVLLGNQSTDNPAGIIAASGCAARWGKTHRAAGGPQGFVPHSLSVAHKLVASARRWRRQVRTVCVGRNACVPRPSLPIQPALLGKIRRSGCRHRPLHPTTWPSAAALQLHARSRRLESIAQALFLVSRIHPSRNVRAPSGSQHLPGPLRNSPLGSGVRAPCGRPGVRSPATYIQACAPCPCAQAWRRSTCGSTGSCSVHLFSFRVALLPFAGVVFRRGLQWSRVGPWQLHFHPRPVGRC